MQLDDWVLCRIKQKGNMSKNAWDHVQHSTSKLVGDLTNMKEQFPSVNTNNAASDICSNYFLSKDCHLLAKLLATHQYFPSSISTLSRTTSQSSNNNVKNWDRVYEHGQGKGIPVINSYNFHGSFNSQEKPNDETEYGNFSQPIPHSNKHENLVISSMLAANGTSFCNQHESQGAVFKNNLSNAIMNLQELDVAAFAERFLQ